MMLFGELLSGVTVKKSALSFNSTFGSRAVSVTRYGVVTGFLDESFKVLSVVGCVIDIGCSDLLISVKDKNGFSKVLGFLL